MIYRQLSDKSLALFGPFWPFFAKTSVFRFRPSISSNTASIDLKLVMGCRSSIKILCVFAARNSPSWDGNSRLKTPSSNFRVDNPHAIDTHTGRPHESATDRSIPPHPPKPLAVPFFTAQSHYKSIRRFSLYRFFGLGSIDYARASPQWRFRLIELGP